MTVEFNSNFKLAYKTNYDYCYFGGVDDISEGSPALITCTDTLITISNFKAVAKNSVITIYFRA